MFLQFSDNPYVLLPYSCGFIVIIIGYIKLWKLRKSQDPNKIEIFGIWRTGIIAFLLGILGQMLTIKKAFDTIAEAGDISPPLVADGIRSSYNSTLAGLIVLIISLIVWGILKGIKQKRSNIIGI